MAAAAKLKALADASQRADELLLKKINETTLFLRETQNGKFGRPGAQFAYCPAAIQNAYINARKKRQ